MVGRYVEWERKNERGREIEREREGGREGERERERERERRMMLGKEREIKGKKGEIR